MDNKTQTKLDVLDHGFVNLKSKTGHIGASVVDSARCSYGSSGDSLGEKDKKLISFLFEQGHSCFDDQTEVLTSEGFIPWPDVTKKHELAVVDPTDGNMLGFERPKTLVDEPYSGPMVTLDSRDVSMLVTPNHKLYASRSSTKKRQKNPVFKLTTAEDIWDRPMRLMSTAAKNLQTSGSSESLAWFRFLGFYVGDGYVASKNRVVFHLIKERKKKYLRGLLEEIGLSYLEKEGSRGRTEFWIKLNNAKKVLGPYGLSSSEKTLPDSALKLSMGWALSLLDGIKNSAGIVKRTTWLYSTTSVSLASKIQALGVINGIPFSLTRNSNGLYNLQARTRSGSPRVNDTADTRTEITEYHGRVYCASVSTGLLIVRRKGKVHLSGNSPFRHAFFTFHIKMPLFVVMQFTKYQVGSTWRTYETEDGQPVVAVDLQYDTDKGCSWNQISGRFKVMDCEFYHPAEWRGQSGKQAGNSKLTSEISEEEKIKYEAWCVMATDNYNRAIDAGIAREMARMYLPPGLYTEAYWTVSLQALLHFLSQRLKPNAQYEIRMYAEAIRRAVQSDLDDLGIEL